MCVLCMHVFRMYHVCMYYVLYECVRLRRVCYFDLYVITIIILYEMWHVQYVFNSHRINVIRRMIRFPVGGEFLYSRMFFSNAQSRTKAIRNPPNWVHYFRLRPGKMSPTTSRRTHDLLTVLYCRFVLVLLYYYCKRFGRRHMSNIGSCTRTIFNCYLCYITHYTSIHFTRWPAGTTEMTTPTTGHHIYACNIVYVQAYIFIMFILYSYRIRVDYIVYVQFYVHSTQVIKQFKW